MTQEPQHHLPEAINASTMVIRSQRGQWRFLLDCVLTVLAWLAFALLFARGIWSIATKNRDGIEMPFLSEIAPTVSDLGIYILAMLLHGGLLILWARYNYLRFRGKQRRSPSTAPLAQLKLMADYGITLQTLNELRTLPISVIHHAPDGSIIKATDLSVHTPINHSYAPAMV